MINNLVAQHSGLAADIVGRWRTIFHYRTEHPLDMILERGDEYWSPLCYDLKPGDRIDVEDLDRAWEFTLSVRAVDKAEQRVEVELRGMGEVQGGVRIYDNSKMEEHRREVRDEENRKAAIERRQAEWMADQDTPDLQPQVVHRGAGKWCIQAYGEIVERGIDSKEAAEKLLADDGIKARVEEFRHFYMQRKLGEFRNGIARGTIQLDPDLPNPAEVA